MVTAVQKMKPYVPHPSALRKRFDHDSRIGPRRFRACRRRADEKAENAARFGSQLQRAEHVRLNLRRPGEDGAHALTTERLVQAPEIIPLTRRANKDDPRRLDA
jgi:hypothetical protein